MFKRWFTIVLLIIFVTGWVPVHPVQSQTAEETENILVDSSDPSARRAVEAAGGKLLAEYEIYSLWQVPAGAKRTGLRPSITPVDNSISLRGVTLQPRRGDLAIPTTLRQDASTGPGLWIVQFAGPILPGWLEDLQDSGLELVAYLPNNAYVVWGNQPSVLLQSLDSTNPLITWQGAYHPYYRLAPGLRPDDERSDKQPETVDVTVQLYQTASAEDALTRLKARAEKVILSATNVGNLINIRVRIPSDALAEVASMAEVLNVEPYVAPQLLDEVQGQIMAGNISTTSGDMLLPSGPGYLNWLATKGFPIDPGQYPLVDVTDDGLDTGDINNILHPDFYTFGVKAYGRRVIYAANCTSDPIGNGGGGHGNLNAGIVAGYNTTNGFPYKDANGYSYGLGISPYGTIASTKIFSNAGYFQLGSCGDSLATLIQNAYLAGTRITSNSWGAPVDGAYTADAQEYDALTRDASYSIPANQEMFHIFSAGNDGPYGETIGSPGTGKNVLTVGATENVRDQGVTDGCNEPNANNASDMARFSSRGPATDGRIKPDIVAPGTHIMGPASQDPGFNGSGVCGMYPTSSYYPAGQTLYTWSTGTSHSTPAVAGAAQLVYNYYKRVLNPGALPSPAMQKALMLNTPRYLVGASANDTLPSSNQGWGMTDLGSITDGVPRIVKDQNYAFTASGQTPYQITGFIADASKPFHVSLVWTDAPGNTVSGVAAVNNLNLEVVAGGQVYKGNVFNKNTSVAGGNYDNLNNVENVYLPAGLTGMFRVRVYPQNIAGNGMPGNAYSTDQDFALVVYNGAEAYNIPVLALSGFSVAEKSGNHNAFFEPGETFTLQVGLANLGTAATANLAGNLATTDPLVTITNTGMAPAIVPGGALTLAPSFDLTLSPLHPCGGTIPLFLGLNYGPYQHPMRLPDLQVGGLTTTSNTYTAAGLPVAIPLGTNLRYIPLTIPANTVIDDINVHMSLTHSYVGDLELSLVSPSGHSTLLSGGNGGSGDNYTNTIFDDEASTSITWGIPPFTGSFIPELPLSTMDGLSSYGTWNLEVRNNDPTWAATTVTDFKLTVTQNQPVCTTFTLNLNRKLYLPNLVK